MYSIREDPYLECRRGAVGHDWDDIVIRRKTQWGYPEDFRCTKCTMEKYLTIDSLGNISISPRYIKPAGWDDYGPWSVPQIRTELRRRRSARR
jgi:hypothetical protein